MLQKLTLQTTTRNTMLDLTAEVQRIVQQSKVRDGMACIFTPHTTAAITVNEHADPDVARDMLAALSGLVPPDGDYRHAEENSDSHIKSALVGCSQTVIIEEGRLLLGRWQGVFFCEFDGPRQREVWIKIH